MYIHQDNTVVVYFILGIYFMYICTFFNLFRMKQKIDRGVVLFICFMREAQESDVDKLGMIH